MPFKEYSLPDGRALRNGTPFELDGVNYPGNWLELATAEDLSSRSITVAQIADPQPALADVKKDFARRVDEDAERLRLKYVTPGAGMSMTYQEKHAQARAVSQMGQAAANALTEPERDDQFPTLSASVGIEGATLWDCALLVIQKYEQFADLSRVIERTRLMGKKSISDASDVASVRAAYEGITWTV